MDDIKVDKAEIFIDSDKPTIGKGEKLEFRIIEKNDGTKFAVCVTGYDGQYVRGIVDEEKKEEGKDDIKEEDDAFDGFDGFERGYKHLYAQCKVLVNIKNNGDKVSNASKTKDLDDIEICKSVNKILSLDESIDFDKVKEVVKDRFGV